MAKSKKKSGKAKKNGGKGEYNNVEEDEKNTEQIPIHAGTEEKLNEAPKPSRKALEALFIASLLEQPGALCITALANCCDRLFIPRHAPRSPPILRAALHFLARERTMDEHSAMGRSSRAKGDRTCECDVEGERLLHDSGRRASSGIDPLNFTILELTFALMDALNPRPPPPRQQPNADAPLPQDSPSSPKKKQKKKKKSKKKGKAGDNDIDQVTRVLRMEDWEVLMDAEDQLGPLPDDWVLPEELKPRAPSPPPPPPSPPPPEPEENTTQLEPEEDDVEEEYEPWPTSPADIFPASPSAPSSSVEQVLQNLLLWTAHPLGGSGIFLLLSRLADWHAPFAVALNASPMAVPCALVHLEQACDLAEGRADDEDSHKHAHTHAHADPHNSGKTTQKAPPETYRLALAAVTHFLHHMPLQRLVRVLFDFSDLLEALAKRVPPIFDAMIKDSASTSTSNVNTKTGGQEAIAAQRWWALLAFGIHAGPMFPWASFPGPAAVAWVEKRAGKRVEVDGRTLAEQMRAHRARKVCQRVGCPRRAPATPAVPAPAEAPPTPPVAPAPPSVSDPNVQDPPTYPPGLGFGPAPATPAPSATTPQAEPLPPPQIPPHTQPQVQTPPSPPKSPAQSPLPTLTPPLTLSTCRRCALSSYCSESCQRAAWKAAAGVTGSIKGVAPHKPICDGVNALREALGMGKDDAGWKGLLDAYLVSASQTQECTTGEKGKGKEAKAKGVDKLGALLDEAGVRVGESSAPGKSSGVSVEQEQEEDPLVKACEADSVPGAMRRVIADTLAKHETAMWAFEGL
ncbi:hypothetical protein C8R43DRAFT_226327 [Mycena crocata]|nr:hypothetical protein C8R43DRAFT_226327 [Mycena crocata]